MEKGFLLLRGGMESAGAKSWLKNLIYPGSSSPGLLP